MEQEQNKDLNRERLEIEKQKLELENQKLAFEKEKLSARHNTLSLKPPGSANILAIILGMISVLTVFLPWVKGAASSSASGFGQSYSSNISTDTISGIVASEGQLCILLLIAGIVFNFLGKKLSALFGLLAVVLAVVFYARMQSSGNSISGTGGYGTEYSGSFQMHIQIGWIVSIICFILYTLSVIQISPVKSGKQLNIISLISSLFDLIVYSIRTIFELIVVMLFYPVFYYYEGKKITDETKERELREKETGT